MQFTDKVYTIDEIRAALTPVFDKYFIARAKVFGSYARGEAKSGADLDLVISSMRTLDLHKYYEFVRDLHRALKIRIDITFEEYLNPIIAEEVRENAVVIYEK